VLVKFLQMHTPEIQTKTMGIDLMPVIKRLLISLVLALPLAALLGWLSPGAFWHSFLAFTLLLWVSAYFLLASWAWSGKEKIMVWMIILAFFLRLGVGIALQKGLPVFGFEQEVQQSGYVFRDAFERDMAAWNLAGSNEPLWVSFQSEIKADQYGGLLSLSALLYRYLSPDAHRATLVLMLGAFMAALAIPFFWISIKQRWSRGLANLAAWILLLYPDGILFGSSQMREPYILGFSAIAFWAVVSWKGWEWKRILIFAASVVGMLLISSRIALAIIGFLLVWFLIEQILPRYHGAKWSLWIAAGVVGLLVIAGSVGWFLTTSRFDILVTELGSGWIQKIISEAGAVFRVPIIIVYGLVQPVLPAAIADPTLWIWKIIVIARAAGWYAVAPLLVYGIFTSMRAERGRERNILLFIGGFLLFWLVISSARAGGDAWDNPRYRAHFLPWIALISAWGVQWAVEKKDAWLGRWVLVEVIFLGFFTQWYFSRYFRVWGRMSFWQTVACIIMLSALVLTSGWWWKAGKRLLKIGPT
jgi:hypothetical protein